MAKSQYKVQTWRQGKPGKFRYYYHLICITGKDKIMHVAVTSTRSGRTSAVARLKKVYPGLVVESLRSKPTIK